MKYIYLMLLLAMPGAAAAESWGYTYDKSWVRYLYPQDEEKWWWDEEWWNKGRIPAPRNHEVIMEKTSYKSGDKDVPAYLFRPRGGGKYPGIYFQHGRRGIDDLTLKLPMRLAARGFVVLAPDLWFANFIDKYPIEHDPAVEADAARGMEFLKTVAQVKGGKICSVSHTRGGYITLQALVKHGMQDKGVACWVSSYPHLQDPNLAEPMQVYKYAPEAEHLKVPVLMFMGEHEQYQRHRPITFVYESLKAKGRDVRLIVYPGVGRGFDFRPERVRTFADDLATRDALMRTASFVRKHLAGK
jgi:carboxymethylenebutenolidase